MEIYSSWSAVLFVSDFCFCHCVDSLSQTRETCHNLSAGACPSWMQVWPRTTTHYKDRKGNRTRRENYRICAQTTKLCSNQQQARKS